MSKVFDDLLLVKEYEQCEKCRIVAEKYGCSDETVRRALIKYNVKRTKRHPRPVTKPKPTVEELKIIVSDYYESDATINDLAKKYNRAQETISNAIKKYGHGLKTCFINRKKISDDEIKQEYLNGLSCSEIAKKYEISVERLYRRARKIGITLNDNLQGGHWKRRSSHYGCVDYDNSITLKSVITRYDGICQICGKPVDLSDIKNGHIKRNYPTVDHIIPLSKGGSHTWDNIQLAHMACNAGKCDRLNYTVKREEVRT